MRRSRAASRTSFAFRGNNAVREAMHSAFLYHAIRAGMDMGIVNPRCCASKREIEPALLERVEDVILCRRADAAERLTEYAHEVQQTAQTQPQGPDAWRSGSLEERIDRRHAQRALPTTSRRMPWRVTRRLEARWSVIDRLLMPAMERVGVLFGEGKMFLPQGSSTARVMSALAAF